MKSFFQLAEQARRHRLLREVEEAEANAAVGSQQQQNNQTTKQNNPGPSATTPTEQNDVDFVKTLKQAWDGFFKQNAQTIQKLKELQPAQKLSQALGNMGAEMDNVVKTMTATQQQAAGGNKPMQNNNAAGSNQTGSSAGGQPAVKQAAPPQQQAQS